MKFTAEQLKEIGPFHLSGLPFEKLSEEDNLRVFNALPSELQGLAVSWGCNDTVFREDVFAFLIENQLGMTMAQWQQSETSGQFMPLNFEKLEACN